MSQPSPSRSRRTFLKQSAAAVVGGSLAATPSLGFGPHAGGNDLLKVGLIGCGGRGKGAAVNAMKADDNVCLSALADLFPDKIEEAKKNLAGSLGDKWQVTEERCFVGFNAYKKMMETDVDVVILATSPHYRPAHLRAAVDAGKHIFCEKPVAVDPNGVRSVLATSQLAEKKGLNIVSGLCWRYDLGVRETIKRIKDGAIGDIKAVQENYLTSTLWLRPRQPEWTEMEYENRNWLYYTWLSGDHIVEQFIHSLDKSMWLMDDQPPKTCFGLGGRQVRTDPEYGNIYDHHAVCYEWDSGVKVFAYTRQMKSCYNNVEDYVIGTKGSAEVLANKVNGEKVFSGRKPSMYDQEHKELFAAIRAGTPINNGRYMSLSTMMAIIGREACYTGQTLEWDHVLQADMSLGPKKYEWGPVDVPAPEVQMPGVLKFPQLVRQG